MGPSLTFTRPLAGLITFDAHQVPWRGFPLSDDLERAAAAILGDVEASVPGSAFGFQAVDAADTGVRIAAVDGGSSVLLNARTAGLYSVRAGYLLSRRDKHEARLTTRKLPRGASRRDLVATWQQVCKDYAWGIPLDSPAFDNAHFVPQLAEAERVLAELDAARRALFELRTGDVLALDGSLDEDERSAPLRDHVLQLAADQGVAVAALTKDTSRSLAGVLPFTWELEDLAVHEGIKPPWIVDVTDRLRPTPDGYRVFGVQFDRRAPAFRMDVVAPSVAPVAAALLAACNDPAYAGYPYPLARIHKIVHFEAGEASDLRHDLERILATKRGDRWTTRLFSNGRDVLKLAD